MKKIIGIVLVVGLGSALIYIVGAAILMFSLGGCNKQEPEVRQLGNGTCVRKAPTARAGYADHVFSCDAQGNAVPEPTLGSGETLDPKIVPGSSGRALCAGDVVLGVYLLFVVLLSAAAIAGAFATSKRL